MLRTKLTNEAQEPMRKEAIDRSVAIPDKLQPTEPDLTEWADFFGRAGKAVEEAAEHEEREANRRVGFSEGRTHTDRSARD